jgi:hypothetical protein
MSQAYSISTRRRFGLSRVCGVWGGRLVGGVDFENQMDVARFLHRPIYAAQKARNFWAR